MVEKSTTRSTTKTKKKDFVEVEFIGKANDQIFDTTDKKEAKKIGIDADVKPLIVCIGQKMVVDGFDKELEGKELGKKYAISLQPEQAFGKRNRELIKTIPMSVFRKQEINPVAGLMLNLDGMVAKILSVSGGRVITDFNNPLAGKDIEYEFTIKRKVEKEDEKINSLQDFFFKKRFEFEVKDKKITFKKDASPFLQIFGEKFKEILDKQLEIEKESQKEKEEKGISKNHNTEK